MEIGVQSWPGAEPRVPMALLALQGYSGDCGWPQRAESVPLLLLCVGVTWGRTPGLLEL